MQQVHDVSAEVSGVLLTLEMKVYAAVCCLHEGGCSVLLTLEMKVYAAQKQCAQMALQVLLTLEMKVYADSTPGDNH